MLFDDLSDKESRLFFCFVVFSHAETVGCGTFKLTRMSKCRKRILCSNGERGKMIVSGVSSRCLFTQTDMFGPDATSSPVVNVGG